MTLSMASSQPVTIHYNLGMSRPSSHLLEVEMSIEQLQSDLRELEFHLPVWRPGRYMVLDFAGGIQGFTTTDGKGNPLVWSKIDKSTWRVSTQGTSKVTINYLVYANEFGLRTRGLNDEHAFIDGAAVFMYVEQFRSSPVGLSIHPYGGWHSTTGLEGSGEEFSAPGYDHFIDCPIEIGNQKDFEFTIDGAPHVLSIFGEGNWKTDTLLRDISRIVRVQKEFWGELPYKRYVFLLHCTPSSGGGTEHINSTIMGTRPFVFNNPESYNGFLGLVSHEYFHTWNVKQLRPKGIHPYDYSKENYCQELWIAEGTTSYYDDLLLIPAGFKTVEKYLENIASTIFIDRQRPGNAVQSLAEASYDAWIKYWRGTEQSYNAESDYYGKGASVSLLLDLEIRHQSRNTHSLDDVMRAMYKRFPLSGIGYTLSDFRTTCEEMAGGSLQQFFEQCIYGTAPLSWDEKLSFTGLQIVAKDSFPKPWIGLVTTDAGEKTKITRVLAGSPAYGAGLDIGDEVLALDGSRVRTSDLSDRVAERRSGDALTLSVFRNDKLREFTVIVGTSPVPGYKIVKAGAPTEMQKKIYEAWLRSSWGGSTDKSSNSH